MATGLMRTVQVSEQAPMTLIHNPGPAQCPLIFHGGQADSRLHLSGQPGMIQASSYHPSPHTHTHTHTHHTHTHTHTLPSSPSLSFSLTHTHTHKLSLTHSLTHTLSH